MWGTDIEGEWQRLAVEVMAGMKAWRFQHPKATFNEIETVLDGELARVRARMLQDIALSSKAVEIREKSSEESERPKCPKCGGELKARGQHSRSLVTKHDQVIELTRSYGYCPACEAHRYT